MLKKMLLAGFGGQGIMAMGQLLAYGAMVEGKEVSWLPAYGVEMRGGTANCSVVVSDRPISSPVASEPDVLVVMNKPSLDKFENTLKPGGRLFINSSLIDQSPRRRDIQTYYVPANELADGLGDLRVANVIMLGAILAVERPVKKESLQEALKKVFSEGKQKLVSINIQALQVGADSLTAGDKMSRKAVNEG